MKTNSWLVIGTMLATTAVAQVNTNALPEIPAPATAVAGAAPVVAASTNALGSAPKKKAPIHKKKPARKISEPAVLLMPGPAIVSTANLNIRGQAGLKGEAIGHLKSGDTVTVIAQINLDKHAVDEPAQWAKIALPSGTPVWVDAKYVDSASKMVTARKLNLRAGPGENYSVVGVLEKGTSVAELGAKGDWTKIETPTNAFAFVAAMYLKQEAAPAETTPAVAQTTPSVPATTIPASAETPSPTPIATPVVAAPPIVTQPAAPVAVIPPPVPVPPAVSPMPVPAEPVVDTNPPPPRVVTHQGYVRPSMSVIAPTAYELYDPASGNAIDYLYSTTTNLDLSRYNTYQIIATGPEGLAARWTDTPVLTVQKIYVLSTNPPEGFHRVSSPRASSQRR